MHCNLVVQGFFGKNGLNLTVNGIQVKVEISFSFFVEIKYSLSDYKFSATAGKSF